MKSKLLASAAIGIALIPGIAQAGWQFSTATAQGPNKLIVENWSAPQGGVTGFVSEQQCQFVEASEIGSPPAQPIPDNAYYQVGTPCWNSTKATTKNPDPTQDPAQ